MKKTISLCIAFLAAILLTNIGLAQEKPEGKILYIDTSVEGKNYLATILPDGTGKKILTPSFNDIMFPKMSKKNGMIAFTNKTQDMKSEIFLLNKEGDRLKKIITGAAFEDFSPDGKFLLYTTCDQKAELYVYSLERKRATKISQDLQVVSASWSNNSEWIATTVVWPNGSTDIYLISTLAQGIKRLTFSEYFNEAFPVFSADDKFIAYYTNKYGDNEIEYMNLADKKTQRPEILGHYPTLSSKNQWVAYQKGDAIGLSRLNGTNKAILSKGRTPFWVK